MVPAPTDHPDDDLDVEGEGGGEVSRFERHGRRIATAAVLVLVVALGTIVGRGAGAGLHDVAPVGSGDGDGRDAARTGRVDGEAPGEPTRVVWSEAVRTRGNENTWAVLHGDWVLRYRNEEVDVIDRTDGSLLWTTQGWTNGLVDGAFLVEQPTGLAMRDADTGEVRWRRLPSAFNSMYQVSGTWLFESVGEEAVGSLTSEGAGIRRIDPATGATLWETSFDDSPPWVTHVLEGRLVAEQYISGAGDAFRMRHFVLDLATGGVLLEREGDLVAPVQGGGAPNRAETDSLVLLPGDRALRVESGIATEWSLGDDRPIGRQPDFDARSLQAAGDLVVAVGTEDAKVFDRTTLELLWQTDDHEWLDLYAYAQDPERGLVTGHDQSGTTWFDPRTGEVQGGQDWGPFQTNLDAEGILDSAPHLQYRSHDGTVAWTFGADIEESDASSLRLVDQRLVATIGTSWMIHDLTGQQTRALETREADLGVRWAGPTPLLGIGDGLVTIVRDRVRWSDSSRAVVWRWSKDLGGEPTAVMTGDGSIHVATDEILRSLDPVEGEIRAQRGFAGIRTLTKAGDEALFALADGERSGCVLPDGEGCTVTASRFDPSTLEVRWTSAPIEGACAAATIGGEVVAIPTTDGVTFLSARDGEPVGAWSIEGPACTELAFDGTRFVATSASGLLVGTATSAAPTLLATPSAATTAPVLVAGQALVGLEDPALAAIDLGTGEVLWSFPLEAGLLAPPVVHADSLFVLLVNGQLARLG